MKKLFLTGIVFVMNIISLCASNYYVATTGSDSNNGALATPFLTIQKAVNSSISGSDVIYLRAGTYAQATYIGAKSGITLTSYTGETAIIQGNGTAYTNIIEIYNSSNITISNLTIRNLGVNWAKGILVNGAPCSNITISGNIVTNISYKSGTFNASDNGGSTDGSTGANPIQVVGDNASSAITNVVITNNQVNNCMTGWSEAIALKGNINGFTVSNNIVHDITNIGIDVYGLGSFPALSSNNQPQNGTIKNNEAYKCICNYTDCGAIYVDGGKTTTIINNKVHDNIYGFTVGCENQQGVANATSSGINILDNFVYNNTRSGIMIGTSNDVAGHGVVTNCLISGNTFLKNSTSDQWGCEVVMQYATYLTFKNNIFYGLYPQMFGYMLGASNITYNYNNYYYTNGSQASVTISQQTATSTWTGITLAQFQALVGGDANSFFGNPSMVSDIPANANFHINTGSPCVNTGDPSYSAISGETDFEGEARIQNSRIDIGCDETGTGTNVAVTGVTMSPTTASIAVGSTQQLTATVAPSNATNKSVTWSSSNTAIATVNTSGLVTAVAAGSATITVTTVDQSKTATCALTVTASNVAVTGVSMSPTTASIAVGGTQQLTATVAPSNATNKSVTWSSSNNAIATVNTSGMVTAIAAGSATITVTTVSGSKTATCAVTVTATSSGTYEAEAANNTLSGGAVVSSSANASGGKVVGYVGNNSGTLLFNGINMTAGTYTLTISYISGEARSAQISVNGGAATSVSFPSTGSWTTVGTASTTIQLTGSSNTILFSGTGWAPDIDKIALTLTSAVSVTGVSVSPTTSTITVGGTQQLTATVAPSNATNKNVTWSSSNTSVATVNSSGLVTAVAAGSATITVTTADGAKTANCVITVTAGSGTTITIDGNLSDWSSVSAIATATGQTCTSLKVYDDATYFYFAIAGSGMDVNYQLWMNTDNNTATGYNDWNYTSSGADYYIENGSLRKSTGTAWGWTDVATTITASKSATVTEIRVPRSALGTLSSTMKFAYSDVNTSWSVVSKLGYASYSKLKSASEADAVNVALNSENISIYPNPVSDVLSINLGESAGLSHITVYGMNGSIVYKDQSFDKIKKIDIKEFGMKGIAIVEVEKNGSFLRTKLVIR